MNLIEKASKCNAEQAAAAQEGRLGVPFQFLTLVFLDPRFFLNSGPPYWRQQRRRFCSPALCNVGLHAPYGTTQHHRLFNLI